MCAMASLKYGFGFVASFVVLAMAKNMNGKYDIASGAKQKVPFNDDYASKGHDYVDVWSPEIATHYGESFWHDMGHVAFPPELVQRFKGKVMAITGYEHDHVMVIPTGKPGVNPDKDVGVPFNWVYNHHYVFTVTGSHSEMKQVHAEDGDPMAHGASTKWIAVDKPSAASREDNGIPTSSWFSEGNGGESRKSYHGYPNGYAQLVDSPNGFHINPMNIDTRNRDCGVRPEDVTNCSKFFPGPEPKSARYGLGAPKDTPYSGLLECACSESYGGDPIWYPDAKTKIIKTTYGLKESGSCSDTGKDVGSATDCFLAATEVGINATRFINKSVSDPTLPPACSILTQKDGSALVNFNTGGKASCSGGKKKIGQATSPINVTLGVELDTTGAFKHLAKGLYCKNNRNAKIKRFELKSGLKPLPAAMDSLSRCEDYCDSDQKCWGCSIDCTGDSAYLSGMFFTDCAFNAITSCGSQVHWEGSIHGDISEKQGEGGVATLTVSGPANVWFGVGFNATVMLNQPYTLLVNSSGVIEQKVGDCTDEGKHCPGTQLKSTVKVVSNTVQGSVRTVVMTRALHGVTKDHYSFSSQVDTIPLITAVGKTPVFAIHAAHGNAEISFTSVGTAECICNQGTSGKLCEFGGVNCKEFKKNCQADGPLIAQKNPTCNSIQYAGGLNCCAHQRILLDEAQKAESLKRDLLRYHVKLRFWFQEYKVDSSSGKPSHYDLTRFYYQTEAWATEYDIPPAFRLPHGPAIPGYPEWPVGKPTPGTSCTGTCPGGADCECLHTITLKITVGNMRILYAGGHCHAPSCVSLKLYINTTGNMTLLCDAVPVPGKGDVEHDRFDEKGYIKIPPCLWSDDPAEGLEKSVWLPKNTELVSITTKRNTHTGHYGEMASWQMRGVTWPADSPPHSHARRFSPTFV